MSSGRPRYKREERQRSALAHTNAPTPVLAAIVGVIAALERVIGALGWVALVIGGVGPSARTAFKRARSKGERCPSHGFAMRLDGKGGGRASLAIATATSTCDCMPSKCTGWTSPGARSVLIRQPEVARICLIVEPDAKWRTECAHSKRAS